MWTSVRPCREVHHIDSPGFIMIEKFLDNFRADLGQRGCDLQACPDTSLLYQLSA